MSEPETTRVFSFLLHAQLVEAFDTYVRELGKTPRIEVRGAVDFVEPGKRPNTWRKKREVPLSDWYEVRDWKQDTPLLMIWYHLKGGIYRNVPRLIDQWVRPIPLFDHKWYYLRLCPTFADANAAYFAYLQRERAQDISGSIYPLLEGKMSFEWQFTPDPGNPDAARQYSWPSTPSLPNRVKPGCFKASNYTYLFAYASGIEVNNPDVIDAQTVAQIARGLRTLYEGIGQLPDDAQIDYPEASLLPIRFAVLRDLITIFEFAAQHQCYAIGL